MNKALMSAAIAEAVRTAWLKHRRWLIENGASYDFVNGPNTETLYKAGFLEGMDSYTRVRDDCLAAELGGAEGSADA